MSLTERFTNHGVEILSASKKLARFYGDREVNNIHLFLALLRDPQSKTALSLQGEGVTYKTVTETLGFSEAKKVYQGDLKLAPELVETIRQAFYCANVNKDYKIGPTHLLAGLLLVEDRRVQKLMEDAMADRDEIGKNLGLRIVSQEDELEKNFKEFKTMAITFTVLGVTAIGLELWRRRKKAPPEV